MDEERPQDFGDLRRLIGTLRALALPDPDRRRTRDRLLATLLAWADQPTAIRGGVRPS